MKNKVLIMDTSVLCVWLKVPGKETCGSGADMLDYDKVNTKIQEEQVAGTTFVLPLASIIETGNHIAHASGDRHSFGVALADIISKTADEQSPWASFTKQGDLWKSDKLKSLAERWKETVVCGQSLGDASIVDVANYYSAASFDVEIYTGDKGLKAYEPQRQAFSSLRPRREKSKSK